MKKYYFIFFIIFTSTISCKKDSEKAAKTDVNTENLNNSVQELESGKNQTVINASHIDKQKPEVENAEETEDCKDIKVEMGSGRECIIQNTNLNKAYQSIIKNKEVEESNYFLSNIPSENKSVEVSKNGLISIDYGISKNKIVISMNYEGGVTEVTLEKINNTVKKSIYHYAD